jgi:uncharacterized protein (DUF302 family)
MTSLITLNCRNGPRETAERLVDAVESRGMTVFSRIDHATAAHAVGLALRPTEVIVFGDPRAGTLLMQSVQTLGLDLPLRALIWEDASGATQLSYEDPAALAPRHGSGKAVAVIAKIRALLEAVTLDAATLAPEPPCPTLEQVNPRSHRVRADTQAKETAPCT